MFAELRPNMTRYSSIEDVNAALIELEEHERMASIEKASSEKHSDSESQKGPSQTTTTIKANGSSVANRMEENGRGHEEPADSESYSDSGSVDQEGHEDEEDLLYEDKSDDRSEGDGDDEDDGGPIGSDEEDSVQVRQKLVEVDPKEEEEFDRELRALTQESLESRKLELRARPTLNMMIPMNVFEGSKDSRTIEGESGEETIDEEGGSGGGNNKVRVKVLVKKGNKQQMKQMYIPQDCSLVQSTKQKEAAELEEKQSIKRRILEYNEREEEESNGISSQAGNWMQVGSSGGSSRPVGRGNWDAAGRMGSRQRHHSSSGFYHGYGRRR